MLQTSLLLMKSLNKTEIPLFLSVVCSLFPKAIFLTFILLLQKLYWSSFQGQTHISAILGKYFSYFPT